MSKYDYAIVGSGLFGATFANLAKAAGRSCVVLEKRNHIAGNCYTQNIEGINVHTYGPHIFHTSNKQIWEYVNKFATFNNFVNRPKVNYKDQLYSFPINLFTLYQLWGCKTPNEAQRKLNEVKLQIDNPSNLEEWILSQVGQQIYETFIYGYTKKQWGCDPKELPMSIIKRLPIRLTFDDNYFTDTYQGIPIGGYTQIIEKMLLGVPVQTNTDFVSDHKYWLSKAHKIVYTGALDELLNYKYGELAYRSLRFDTTVMTDISDYQGNAIVNYTDENVLHTRSVEHKHFENSTSNKTVVTLEYPQKWNKALERYYPINNATNNQIYDVYQTQCLSTYSNMILGGRLACYQYMDMHQVIGQAMHKWKQQS